MNTALEDINDHSEEFLDITGRIQSEQVASYDDVVSIESAFPGFITSRCDIHGLTETASLENFGKIKDAVVNAIKAIIEKIKAFIRGIINFFKGSGNSDDNEPASDSADTIVIKSKEMEKLQEELKQSMEKNKEENKNRQVIRTNMSAEELSKISISDIQKMFYTGELTTDGCIKAILATGLNVPFFFMEIKEQKILLDYLTNHKWDKLEKAFSKLLEAGFKEAENKDPEVQLVKMATVEMVENDAASPYNLLETLETLGKGKLTDPVAKIFKKYVSQNSNDKESVENSNSLISLGAALFRRDKLHQGRAFDDGVDALTTLAREVVDDGILELRKIILIVNSVIASIETTTQKVDRLDQDKKDFFYNSFKLGQGVSIKQLLILLGSIARGVGLFMTGFKTVKTKLKKVSKDMSDTVEKGEKLKEGWVRPETDEEIMRALDDDNVKGIVF